MARGRGGLIVRLALAMTAAFALCGAADAADWRLLFSTDSGNRWQYDAGSMQKAWAADGSAHPKVWVRVIFAEPVGDATKSVYQVRLDCQGRSVQMLYEARYDNDGKVVWSGSGEGEKPIVPGSVGEDLHASLCALAE